MGAAAATLEVLAALHQAMEDDELTVHEAANDALARLREIRPNVALMVGASA